jgi:hypothetical protein
MNVDATVEELPKCDKIILSEMLYWNFSVNRISPFSLSKATGYSESAVTKGLRNLNYYGLARKNPNGVWFIPPAVKPDLLRIFDKDLIKTKEEDLELPTI